MKRILLILTLLTVLPATAFAKPALWKVEGDKGTLYVLGTMHRLPEDTEWFDPETRLKILDSDSVILEVRTSQASQDYLGLVSRSDSIGVGRRYLKLQVSHEIYQKLKESLMGFGVEENALNRFRPWLAAILLGQLGGEKAGFYATTGADTIVEIFALENAVPRVGLETSGQQYMILADLPKKSQVYLLEKTLENVEDYEGWYEALYAAWAEGDIEATETLVLNPLRRDSQLYTRLIVRRNKDWTKTLSDILDDGGNHFVAVGTGHLIGPDSVLRLLEKEGYTVTRVQ